MTQDTSEDDRTAAGNDREDGTAAGSPREDSTAAGSTAPETLGEMSHTNPHTGDAFGATQTYDRGRTIAADGGEAAAADGGDAEAPPEEADEERAEQLRDVDHTPPGDSEGTHGVYERGNEGREENR
jgi:hypothetical protein